MLRSLSIKNYALIEELSIDFQSGMSIITGETGAGKSILLGALGLALGKRADSSMLKDTQKKCIVEVHFDIQKYHLSSFFKILDLDYDAQTIIRREILPSGKSRAFVNDTPVTLNSLNELKSRLIDIHSQHQTSQLSDHHFQLYFIDVIAGNEPKLSLYKRELEQYKSEKKKLELLVQQQREANQQHDYHLHLFHELEDANLSIDEQEMLEAQLEKINHVEEIKLTLSEALQITQDEEIGIQHLLYTLESKLSRISAYSEEYQTLLSRISSLKIEFDDVIIDLENANDHVEFSPEKALEINDRLQLIYSLQKKHYVNNNEELLQIWEDLSKKVAMVEDADEIIQQQESHVQKIAKKLDDVALEISQSRKSVVPKLTRSLEVILSNLGMTQATFSIEIQLTSSYLKNGKDEISFLFSANKGAHFGELKKVASGGELSRIMLAVKKLLSENSQLPTIIFDEIDTGVSGEISNKMASIMHQMSGNMQVITITHLPQIAAKRNQHNKVFKVEHEGTTITQLKQLTEDERIIEIAEMLSGKDISDSALVHAKELLN